MNAVNTAPELEELLTPKETAKTLKIETCTLQDWRTRPNPDVVLPYIKVGKLIRYRAKDVQEFLEERTRTSVVGANPRKNAGRPRGR